MFTEKFDFCVTTSEVLQFLNKQNPGTSKILANCLKNPVREIALHLKTLTTLVYNCRIISEENLSSFNGSQEAFHVVFQMWFCVL